MLYGFIPNTQPFRPAAAMPQRSCLFRAIALLARRFPKIPRIGAFGDLGVAASRVVVYLSLRPATKFSNELFIRLRKNKWHAEYTVECPGLAVSFRNDCEEVIAISSLSKERAEKLATLVREFREAVSGGVETFCSDYGYG